MASDAFDEAWDVLKGRSAAPPRRGTPFRRKFNNRAQTTDGAPAAPDSPVNIDQDSMNFLQEQARAAQLERIRHYQKLKQTDPEAYQKYLLEQQYAPKDEGGSSIGDYVEGQ